jgi:N-acyl-D-aspartate/D-glutamate deacylase
VLDLLIRSATVVDGSGSPGYRASVGVLGDRVVRIGSDASLEATVVVDGDGRTLAPGFIDVHTHSDLSPLVDPAMPSAVRQGVTTVVVGNCGSSPWPPAGAPDCAQLAGAAPGELDLSFDSFGAFLEALEDAGPAVNLAALVGHGAVREEVMGLARRPPSDGELRSMRELVGRAMSEGAVGLSTGLIYVPGIFSATDEIVALAREAAGAGGIYASHIRGEGEHLFRAVDEAVEIGRRAGIPAHVSHLKCETELMWGRADELLERLHTAGDATADQYPYTAWSSSLSSLLPGWAPVRDLARALEADRHRLARAVEEGEPSFQSSVRGVGWDRIVIEAAGDGRHNGESVAAIADAGGVAPIDAFLALLLEDPDASCIGHAMHEDDVRAILADPDVMVASDSSAMSPEGPLGSWAVHPRTYGTFPRVLGRYAREERLLTLEQAVRKMTALPAERFGLAGRGLLREGGAADLVLFDPRTVSDASTFERPHAYPAGIDLVVVNGRIAWDGVRLTAGAGRVLRRA